MEGSPCSLTRQLELADMAELLYRWVDLLLLLLLLLLYPFQLLEYQWREGRFDTLG